MIHRQSDLTRMIQSFSNIMNMTRSLRWWWWVVIILILCKIFAAPSPPRHLALIVWIIHSSMCKYWQNIIQSRLLVIAPPSASGERNTFHESQHKLTLCCQALIQNLLNCPASALVKGFIWWKINWWMKRLKITWRQIQLTKPAAINQTQRDQKSIKYRP